MSELIWLNGEVMPLSEARISVEDRGFQFADGVYEVARIYNGKPFAFKQHLARLERSAKGIELQLPLGTDELSAQMLSLIAKSGVREGSIYLQATRGAAPRHHLFPTTSASTLLFYARSAPPIPDPGEGEGTKLLLVKDERWKNCWIKAITLLPNTLARNAAARAGYDEAVFVDNELISECTSSNVFACVGAKLVTHPVGARVLPGITREVLFECAAQMKIEIDERPLREEEAKRADEMFITSTMREVGWVARLNDRYIGKGKCGPVTLALHRALRDRISAETK